MLYWAYGSNLCLEHMKHRCPRARPIRSMTVTNAALVFRHVADVITREDSFVQGGLWRITPECEAALDRYEGVASRMYRKCYLDVIPTAKKKKEKCLYYEMTATRGIYPPGQGYLNTIIQGYKDFGLDLEDLNLAVQESWGEKKPTEEIRARVLRRQDAELAKGVELVKLTSDRIVEPEDQ